MYSSLKEKKKRVKSLSHILPAEEDAPVRDEDTATSSISVRDSDQLSSTDKEKISPETSCQKSIQFLESKSSLTRYEELKLNNLREKDSLWRATKMNYFALQFNQTGKVQVKKRSRSAVPVESKPKRTRRFSRPLPSVRRKLCWMQCSSEWR